MLGDSIKLRKEGFIRTVVNRVPSWLKPHIWYLIAFAVVFFVFWSVALLDPAVSPVFDMLDFHYPHLKFVADALHHGVIPFWNPYLYSGYPLLAESQVGTFYPLNWILFIFGVTGKSMMWLMFGHSLLAAIGAYALAFRLTRDRLAAWVCGFLYAFSGWFIGHTEHFGMFEAASWLPLILLGVILLGERRNWARWLPATAIMLAVQLLTGHLQTSLFTFSTAVVVACMVAATAWRKQGWRSASRYLGVSALAALFSLGITAIQLVPTVQLLQLSSRNTLAISETQAGSFEPQAWRGFIVANAHGVVTQNPYRVPGDISQYYLYLGAATVGLVLLGVISRRRYVWLWLVVGAIAVAYSLGRHSSFHLLVTTWIPIFNHVRDSNRALIVAMLALDVLAAYGITSLRRGRSWRTFAAMIVPLLLITIAYVTYRTELGSIASQYPELVRDIKYSFYWSAGFAFIAFIAVFLRGRFVRVAPWLLVASLTIDVGVMATFPNHDFFYRGPLGPDRPFAQILSAALEPGARFDEERLIATNQLENFNVSTTWGYGQLIPLGYAQYYYETLTHPRLLDALNVRLNYSPVDGSLRTRKIKTNLAFFPAEVKAVQSGESLPTLRTIDPLHTAIVDSTTASDRRWLDPGKGSVQVEHYDLRGTDLTVNARDAGLLVIGQTFYPGIEARIDGTRVGSVLVDVGLTGVYVPTGTHHVSLTYRPTPYAEGGLITLASLGLLYGFTRFLHRRKLNTSK